MSASVPISFEFFPPNTPVGSEKLKTVVQDLSCREARVLQRHLRRRGFHAREDAGHRAGHRRARASRPRRTCRAWAAPKPASPRSWPPTARRASAAWWRCAATCPAAPPRPVSFATPRTWWLHPPHPGQRLAHRSGGLPRIPPAAALCAARPGALRGQGQGRRGLGHHAVLLQPRRLLPLRRRGARAGRHGAHRAGHHAHPQLRQDRAVSRRATASRSRAGWR
jgi:hypothetical protein